MKSSSRARAVAAVLASVVLLLLAGVLLFHNAVARGFFSVAKGCVGRNDPAAAARWTSYAIHFASGDLRLDLHESRISYLMGAGKRQEALEEVDRLLERDPSARGGRIWLQRGDVLIHLRRFDEARAEAGRFLGATERSPDLNLIQSALCLQAEASLAEGDRARALREYRSAEAQGEGTEWGKRARKAAADLSP